MQAFRTTSGSTPVFACALTVAIAIGVTGCTGGSQPNPPASHPAASSAATSPDADPSAAAATQAAVAAYNGYIAAFAGAAQQADPDDPNLPRYLAGPLLILTRHNLGAMKDRGQVQVGAQTATVTSTQVDLASTQPAVTIHACLDYSSIKLVYKSTRSLVPNSEIKNPKVSAVATVWLFKTGQWLVTDTKDGGGPC